MIVGYSLRRVKYWTSGASSGHGPSVGMCPRYTLFQQQLANDIRHICRSHFLHQRHWPKLLGSHRADPMSCPSVFLLAKQALIIWVVARQIWTPESKLKLNSRNLETDSQPSNRQQKTLWILPWLPDLILCMRLKISCFYFIHKNLLLSITFFEYIIIIISFRSQILTRQQGVYEWM